VGWCIRQTSTGIKECNNSCGNRRKEKLYQEVTKVESKDLQPAQKTTGTGDTYDTLTSTTVKKNLGEIHSLFVSKRGGRNMMKSISTFVCFERRFVKKL